MAALVAVLLLLLVAAPGTANADDDQEYLQACLAAAGGQTGAARTTCFGQVSEVCLAQSQATTQDMVDCARRETAAWQTLMEGSLARLAESQPEPRVAVIREAQVAWRDWRDARCAVYGTYDGSIYGPLAGLCRAETTSRRVVDLWEIEAGFTGG